MGGGYPPYPPPLYPPLHDLRIRSTVTLPTELRGRTEKVGDDFGGESRRRESKGTYSCFDKGCPTKALKRTRQCRLVLWEERVWR